MTTLTSYEARQNWASVLDTAITKPVYIVRRGKKFKLCVVEDTKNNS